MVPKVLIVFGTRPEAIKMMPVVRELASRVSLEYKICVTGQHRQMLDQVFNVFGVAPNIDLNIMSPNQTLSSLTASVLGRVTEIIQQERPSLVLVHGDTTSAMAASLSAFYSNVPVGHVEAGLRSFDLARPWPEEYNRVAIDTVASLMFAPTDQAAQNLKAEYNQSGKVFVTGNTGIDALFYISELIECDPALHSRLQSRYSFLDGSRRLILVTGHRRESFGEGFRQICDGLSLVARRPDVQIVYPVHLNPNVQNVVRERLAAFSNIFLIAPVEYVDMVYLMQRSEIIITDSGGIQEEAPALGKPVLVMREVTERPEAVATGVVKLIGTSAQAMILEVEVLLDSPEVYERRAKKVFPYGDGRAAGRIANEIQAFLFG